MGALDVGDVVEENGVLLVAVLTLAVGSGQHHCTPPQSKNERPGGASKR